MVVYFSNLQGVELSMLATVGQFMQGALLSHLAEIGNQNDPVEIVRDHLPDFDPDDDDAVCEAFGEAFMLASQYEPPGSKDAVLFAQVLDIEVWDEDLPDIREVFLNGQHPPAPVEVTMIAA